MRKIKHLKRRHTFIIERRSLKRRYDRMCNNFLETMSKDLPIDFVTPEEYVKAEEDLVLFPYGDCRWLMTRETF